MSAELADYCKRLAGKVLGHIVDIARGHLERFQLKNGNDCLEVVIVAVQTCCLSEIEMRRGLSAAVK